MQGLTRSTTPAPLRSRIRTVEWRAKMCSPRVVGLGTVCSRVALLLVDSRHASSIALCSVCAVHLLDGLGEVELTPWHFGCVSVCSDSVGSCERYRAVRWNRSLAELDVRTIESQQDNALQHNAVRKCDVIGCGGSNNGDLRTVHRC